jgi:hypothetical protein
MHAAVTAVPMCGQLVEDGVLQGNLETEHPAQGSSVDDNADQCGTPRSFNPIVFATAGNIS